MLRQPPDNYRSATKGHYNIGVFQQKEMQWHIFGRLPAEVAHPRKDMSSGCTANNVGRNTTWRNR
jgi:hypothetical protein